MQLQAKKLPLAHPSVTSILLSRTSGLTKALVLRDEKSLREKKMFFSTEIRVPKHFGLCKLA